MSIVNEKYKAPRPKIVCLCGSTRFMVAYKEANYRETMAGNIVLSVGAYPHGSTHGEGVGCTPEQKKSLDALHLRKIDMADEVLILNVGGYIGDSTRKEIDYAMSLGKPVRYLENPTPLPPPTGAAVALPDEFSYSDRDGVYTIYDPAGRGFVGIHSRGNHRMVPAEIVRRLNDLLRELRAMAKHMAEMERAKNAAPTVGEDKAPATAPQRDTVREAAPQTQTAGSYEAFFLPGDQAVEIRNPHGKLVSALPVPPPGTLAEPLHRAGVDLLIKDLGVLWRDRQMYANQVIGLQKAQNAKAD